MQPASCRFFHYSTEAALFPPYAALLAFLVPFAHGGVKARVKLFHRISTEEKYERCDEDQQNSLHKHPSYQIRKHLRTARSCPSTSMELPARSTVSGVMPMFILPFSRMPRMLMP